MTWLENLPTHNATRQPFGTETLDDGVVKSIEEISAKQRKAKEMVVQVIHFNVSNFTRNTFCQ